MYEVGQLVQYGSTGVCKITEIKKQDFPEVGQRLYYVLHPLYQSCVISVPVDSTKVFMRPIISREEAERLIAGIPSLRCQAFHGRAARDLAAHYETLLERHDCQDWMELTMSIHAKKESMQQQKRRFGSVDERFLKQGEDLLFGELAAALDIPREEVQQYITARVESLKEAG